ncbi:TPA: DUF5623 domain-containing protein [Pseudomonas aeruginosa]|uniref:DUF5623 domain-containing protein n=1 Tax=Pseudomonas aeruginosa TaxID=287 RepID=UPI003D6F243F|nr:DUF5623 domain-containing protein [Pseudomonas aeruginosa]HBO5327082.1 DUF5623 domain-containing protein [Pseudomonas aeruginosa]HCR1769288.1 DUF5623 domain-containing protein [Pseudomonas aeruginosa]
MRHQSNSALPSSLPGLKRLAKSIGRQQEIPHFQALNQAAQDCGYQDYHHARRVLERPNTGDLPTPGSYSIYLSAYWRDTSTKPFQWGLETLKIELPSPLLAIVQKHQCGSARNLEAFYIEYEDHLEMRGNLESQVRARELLYRAALTLQFMEATGLRPATTKVQRKKMQIVEELPERDHLSRWLAPSGQWVVLDEPYEHITKPKSLEPRAAWVGSHALFLARPTWSGLYYPNKAVPHLICADQALLQQLVKTIEAMPNVVSLDLDEWQGSTADYRSQFVSPAREAAGAKRKPRPGTTYGSSKNAIEYWRRPGFKPLWRPDPSMSLANHIALGEIFQRLSVSGLHIDAYNTLGGIRSELENWMFAENSWGNRKCTREEEDAYYSGNEFARYRTTREQLKAVDRVHAILTRSYLDCAPLRKMLKRLAAARAVMAESAGL